MTSNWYDVSSCFLNPVSYICFLGSANFEALQSFPLGLIIGSVSLWLEKMAQSIFELGLSSQEFE